MIRTHTKDTVIVNGGVQGFEFQNDVDAIFDLYNSLIITNNVPISSGLRFLDKNKNGFIWRYIGNTNATNNVLNLYAIVNNVIQPNPVISINQSTLQITFVNNLRVRNSDGSYSSIGTNATELANLLQQAKDYSDAKITALNLPTGAIATQSWVSDKNYLTNVSLNNYVTLTNLTAVLLEYVKITDFNTYKDFITAENYVKNANLTTTLSGYVTTTSLTIALSNYKTNAELNTALSGYVTIIDFEAYKNSQSSGGGSAVSYKEVNTTPYQILATDSFLGVSTLASPMMLSLNDNAVINQNLKIMDAKGNSSINKINIFGNIANPNNLAVLSTLNVGSGPCECAITPNGKYAYIINRNSNNVTVIKDLDTLTPSVLKTITTGQSPYDIKITPNGNFVYICNNDSNNVTVIKDASTSNPTVLRTLTVGTGPQNLLISPDGSNVYVLCTTASRVYFLYMASSSPQVGIYITTGQSPIAMASSPDGNFLYILNYDSSSVTIIKDAFTNPSLLTTINVGTNPYSIKFTPDGNYAYIYCVGSSPAKIYIIKNASTTTPTLLSNMDVDVSSPSYLNKNIMQITPDGKYLYIGCSSMSLTTTRIFKDISTDNPVLLKTINTGTNSNAITIAQSGKFAYVYNTQYGISLIKNIDTDYPIAVTGLNFTQNSPVFLYCIPNKSYVLYNISGDKIEISSLSKMLNTNFAKTEFLYNGNEWLNY